MLKVYFKTAQSKRLKKVQKIREGSWININHAEHNDLEDITMGDYHPSSNRTQSMELVEKYGMYISNNRDINQPLTEWYASCYPHCESRNESDTHAEVIQMGSTLMEAVCNAVIANFERIEYEKN